MGVKYSFGQGTETSLYGFNLDNNIDLGRAPIEFRETIRFEEFLEGPISL